MRCRICGCTDDDPCVNSLGHACGWADDDLCTFCALEEGLPFHVGHLYPGVEVDAFGRGRAPLVELFSEVEATRFIDRSRRERGA